MKILVIGGGGREHALCWRFEQDGHEVLALPGSSGIAEVAECVAGSLDNLEGVVRAAERISPELVVIGPEAPLVRGLADLLRARGLPVFGPSALGAQLEGSKSYSKAFFARHGIRSAQFFVCETRQQLESAISEMGERMVVKANGLAAGKGVVLCFSSEQALNAGLEMLEEGRFGEAGSRVVVEQLLVGRELSVMALCDGKRCEILASAEDHKTIFDGDRGPNTGGMGAVSPPEWVSEQLVERIRREVFEPTLAGLRHESIDFRGVLYAGIMVDDEGAPWLLEYNVRFGDPETQAIVVRVKSDLGMWLLGAANGHMPKGHIEWDSRAAVCVVLASAGYPQGASRGDPIRGVAAANALPDVQVFHAGTAKEQGAVITAGGRVLGVSALGTDIAAARARAYQASAAIDFPGMQYRRDIGARSE